MQSNGRWTMSRGWEKDALTTLTEFPKNMFEAEVQKYFMAKYY